MKRAIILVGMQWGDESKGATVDFLCRRLKPDIVVRYSGGSQCGHNVVLADGRRHTFSQFGSGTLAGVPTYLGPNVIINPPAMVNEAEHLKQLGIGDPWDMIHVHPDCLVTTVYHQWVNQVEELKRGEARHGSCGHGIGETRSYWLDRGEDAICCWDLVGGNRLRAKLELLRQRLLPRIHQTAEYPQCRELSERFLAVDPGTVARDLIGFRSRVQTRFRQWPDVLGTVAIFEGAQGVLLDEHYGFPPHCTWSTVTDRHALELLAERDCRNVKTLGVVRAFTTRHGAGPLPTADLALTNELADQGNPENPWQGSLRTGWFDFTLFRYATKVQPIDGVAVNWLDRFPESDGIVSPTYADGQDLRSDLYPNLDAQRLTGSRLEDARPRYERISREDFLRRFPSPVIIRGFGPTAEDRIADLDLWS